MPCFWQWRLKHFEFGLKSSKQRFDAISSLSALSVAATFAVRQILSIYLCFFDVNIIRSNVYAQCNFYVNNVRELYYSLRQNPCLETSFRICFFREGIEMQWSYNFCFKATIFSSFCWNTPLFCLVLEIWHHISSLTGGQYFISLVIFFH